MCRARRRSHRLPPLQITRKHLLHRTLLVTGVALASAVGLRSSDVCGQYDIGAQAGWTGLSYETDTIAGVGSLPLQFSAGYNVGVRGGYQLGPWRFEEEYSYRKNNLAEFGADDATYGVSGNRHTHSIMTNVLYDVAIGWPVTPHIGVGIGAMNVVDELRVSGRGPAFNDSNWQFAYQAIVGVRYDINPVFALDLDYRYLATTESTFRIPDTNLHYSTGDNTNNFVLSLTYRFGGPLPSETLAAPVLTSP
jgi:opacity protein-like surface antigen